MRQIRADMDEPPGTRMDLCPARPVSLWDAPPVTSAADKPTGTAQHTSLACHRNGRPCPNFKAGTVQVIWTWRPRGATMIHAAPPTFLLSAPTVSGCIGFVRPTHLGCIETRLKSAEFNSQTRSKLANIAPLGRTLLGRSVILDIETSHEKAK